MQPKEDIEKQYKVKDPWGFESNPQDRIRKQKIIDCLKSQRDQYERALDIGCGEGFITKDIPARKVYGYEISDQARARLPKTVAPVLEPLDYSYDLITATGVFYGHYDWKHFGKIISCCATDTILLCNISDWEVPNISDRDWVYDNWQAREVFSMEFPYREWHQRLRVFEKL